MSYDNTFLLAVYFFIFFIFLPGMLLNYILKAYAITKLSKSRNFDYFWIAWIPFFSVIAIPAMVNDEDKLFEGKLVYIFSSMLLFIYLIEDISFYFILATFSVYLYSFFVLIEQYSSKKIFHLISAVFSLGLTITISLLLIMKREPNKKEKIDLIKKEQNIK